MREKYWTVMLVALIILMTCSGVIAQPQENDQVKADQSAPKPIKHLIFITIDGLGEELVKNAYVPNLNGLKASGVQTSAIGILPANSFAYMASLLTGADPEIHGLTQSGKQSKSQMLPEIVNKYGRAAAYVAPAEFISGGFFNGPGETGVLKFGVQGYSNSAVINKAIEIFKQTKPYFLGIKLPGIDRELIKKGSAADISKEVSLVDEQMGRLLVTLRSQEVYDECLIVVTGNYMEKMITGEFSANSTDMAVPVIMSGPGLKSGAVLPPVRIIDITPTVVLLAGLHKSPESNGLVIWNALMSGTGFVEENLLLKRVNDLSEETVKSAGLIYRLTEEKRQVRTEKEKIDKEKFKVQQRINRKDSQIRILKWKIRFLYLAEGVTVLAMTAGYIIEYFYLRKKFLMF